MDYYAAQVAQLGESDRYRLKITSDNGESKWLRITPGQLTRIARILAEGDEEGHETTGSELTVYLVGEDDTAARESMVFDDHDTAERHRDENEPGAKVYSASATVDFTTLEPA
ncbi:hypothetical protein [Prauserella muralis]|uniref:Uncharacterized protein n=1 Tax=Prauserella muralis TaxID=588067 RepID=A0A2V4AVG5_9PSEU|nr:hypothetical protein [Prauserella muralis]PXY25426.1 hypothetical protein BAY60_18805 [Prauserella muralis]TWE27543.1 hypothetical protein FHX69_0179 [Prauserella muralis]